MSDKAIIKIAVILGLLSLVFIWFIFLDKKTEKITLKGPSPKYIYEAAVMLKDQKTSDTEEDKKSFLKRGDVININKAGHKWSKMELVSYFIFKIELTEEEASKLVGPKKEGETVVLARGYKIDLEKLGNPMPLDLLNKKDSTILSRVFNSDLMIKK